MGKDLSKCIMLYKEQLEKGYIQKAYSALTHYMAELKTNFPRDYATSNLAYGYLDYTYFYFSNPSLKSKKLKFGIVLNHQKMQFELWLLGQTVDIRREYWNIMKDTKWCHSMETMPQYSILEICLEDKIDFENKDQMTRSILDSAIRLAKDIQSYLER